MTKYLDRSLVLLEDAEFAVCLNSNYPPSQAPGFLLRLSLPSQLGVTCIGSFEHRPSDGRWFACITCDQSRDSICVGDYADRMNAIAALWLNRSLAGKSALR